MDGEEISATELRVALAADRKERPSAPRDDAAEAASRQRVLRDLIDRTLLEQAARTHGIKVLEHEVDRALQLLKLDYPDDSFEALLASEGLGLEELRLRLQRQLLIERLFAEEVFSRVAITDAEVDAWLAEHLHELDRPAQVRALQLVVKTEEEAQELLAQLRKGGDFETLAREHSLSPDARFGGDLGWFAQGEMPPPFDEVCFGLGVGKISGVVGSSFGFHVFKVLEKRGARQTDPAEARDEAEARLRTEKDAAAQEAYLETLRATASIRIDEAALQRLTVKKP